MKPLLRMVLALGCSVVAWSATSAKAETAVESKVPAQTLGLTLTSDTVLSGEAEMKSSESQYRHVMMVHSSWDLSQFVPVGDTGSVTFGLGYNISHCFVQEPSGWEEDDFWKEYKRTHPDWDKLPIPKRMQSLVASMEFSRVLNDKWSLSTTVAAGSYVGNCGLLSDGWGVAVSSIGLYRWKENVTFAVGAAYDSLSHDYRFVPILGFDWQINEKWSAAIGFPSTSVTYKLNRRFTLSWEASGSGGTYCVKEDPAPGIAPRSLANSKLETLEIRVGSRITWKINDRFSVNAASGLMLYREFKYIDRNYKLKSHNASSFLSVGGSVSF
jgi:hypothetical protein